jgi:hypothetical protein
VALPLPQVHGRLLPFIFPSFPGFEGSLVSELRLKPEAVTVQYVASSAVGTVVAFLLSSPCCTEENRLQLEA